MYQPGYAQAASNNGPSIGLTKLEVAPKAFEGQKYPCMEKQLWAGFNSCVRIIPGYDQTTGAIYPQYVNPTELWDANNPGKHLSDTFFSVRVIDTFGRKGCAVIAQFDPTSEEATMFPFTPFESFANIVQASVDNNRKGIKRTPIDCWKTWRSIKDGQLGWVTTGILMQVVGTVVNDGWFSNDETRQMAYGLVYLTHGPSKAGFLKAATMPQNSRMNLDARTNSNLGPIAELDGIWTFFNSNSYVDEKNKPHKELIPSYCPPGADPRTTMPLESKLTEDFVHSVWTPWNKLLKFYTMEEQFRILAQTFGADTVNYVFQDLETEPYIPMDIRQQGLGRYARLIQPDRGPRARVSTADAMAALTGAPKAGQFAAPPQAPAAPSYSAAPQAPAVPPALPTGMGGGVPGVAPVAAPAYAPTPAAPQAPAAPAMPTGMGGGVPGVAPVAYAPAPTAPAAPTGVPVPYTRVAAPAAGAISPEVQRVMEQAMVQGVRVQGSPGVPAAAAAGTIPSAPSAPAATPAPSAPAASPGIPGIPIPGMTPQGIPTVQFGQDLQGLEGLVGQVQE